MDLNDVVKEIKSLSDEEAEKSLKDFLFKMYGKYIDTIEFYANPENYTGIAFAFDSPGDFAVDWSKVDSERWGNIDWGTRPGNKAREALDNYPTPALWNGEVSRTMSQFEEFMVDEMRKMFDGNISSPAISLEHKMLLEAIKREVLFVMQTYTKKFKELR